MNETTDQELMMRVRDGDVERLGPLFERHHRRLYGFCLRLTGSPPISEDLVQEVFCRILRYRHTFRDDGDFRFWLYRLTRNVCTDHFRKLGRAPTVSLDADDAGGADRRPAPGPLPDRDLESAEAHELLRRALARLPHEKRELLLLARFRELRYEQIGELLGCTVGAVKVRVHRAVKELREVYGRLAEEVTS